LANIKLKGKFMAEDLEVYRHKEWLGLLQPVGLVVSPIALISSQAILNRSRAVELQQRLQALIINEKISGEETPWLPDFPNFVQQVLEWYPEDLIGSPGQEEIPPDLEIYLPEYEEILRPTYAVRDPETQQWLMLIKVTKPHQALDEIEQETDNKQGWKVSLQAKFERLLRETKIPMGILFNGREIRLVYAPRGESSGYLSFPVKAMTEVSGRLILGALDMLLGADRLFNLPCDRRLGKILENSRNYQAEVSTLLAEQVLDALWELLRGFQMADVAVSGLLLGKLAQTDPQHIYGGLITTLMRLVFLLYAEDEGLMPNDSIYQNNYSVGGLFDRLREDVGNHPDTMDQRYGAWAWLLSLFRLVYDGGGATPDYLPARHGQLFDPLEYPFLEGRELEEDKRQQARGNRQEATGNRQQATGKSQEATPTSCHPEQSEGSPPSPSSDQSQKSEVLGSKLETSPSSCLPRIPDGVIYRILNKLLILNGERLSYRSLDVEQIGSVYEAIMGYTIEQAKSPSIGVNSKPKGSKHSTTVVIDVAALLATKPGDRPKFLQDQANCTLTPKGLKDLKAAQTLEEAITALDRKVSARTAYILPKRALYLQPTEERRRSGSHYTPRQLTQPIVETALKPILQRLGAHPTSKQILELKVCDLAMGSGAFLVEACRQLAEKLVEAWCKEGEIENLPVDIEPLLLARRLVAQRCLYGVDKNPFAVNLAKLSIWLVTLARDFPFTFVDHALKCGDSLVGLTRAEIGSFGQDPSENLPLMNLLKEQVEKVKNYRHQIQSLDTRTDADTEEKVSQLEQAEGQLAEARLTGNASIAAFFAGKNSKEREEKRIEYGAIVRQIRHQIDYLQNPQSLSVILSTAKDLSTKDVSPTTFPSDLIISLPHSQHQDKPMIPFHWEIEFPEVFEGDNPGFDIILGNPPFAGKNTAINAHPEGYMDWLKEIHPESHGNSDIVAHFFRRTFTLLRQNGTFGLIATNTIAQGDTRSTGLRFICQNGGKIYQAQKRIKWAGLAAVVVSVVHGIKKPTLPVEFILDGKIVPNITAFLFHAGGHDNPKPLIANQGKSFQGSIVLGMGFTFDDTNPDATPIAEMQRLIEKDPRNAERIFPYIGGEEVNSSPTHAHHRYVINFGEMSEQEARKYPDLMKIVEEKVKPERDRQKRDALRIRWWQYAEKRPGLVKAIAPLDRVLVIARVSKYAAFTFLPANIVINEKAVVFPFETFNVFCLLQSRIHEIFALFFSSTMKDDINYSSSDCFETFPFPENWETNPTLETIGQQYYQYRAELMIRNSQGLTATYNRFHDPDETHEDILHLRSLHEQMDRAVLDAYGWTDIPTTCEFLLDYEEEEETDSKRKKPWRYRWPEEIHHEVLARLLELNQQRYDEEVTLGVTAQKKTTQKAKKSSSKTAKQNTPTLPFE